MNYVLPAHLQEGSEVAIEQPLPDSNYLLPYADAHITSGPFGDYLVQTSDDAGFEISLCLFQVQEELQLTAMVSECFPMLVYILQGEVRCHLPGLSVGTLSEGAYYLMYVPCGVHSLIIGPGEHAMVQISLTLPMLDLLSRKHYEFYQVTDYVFENNPGGIIHAWAPLNGRVWELLRSVLYSKLDEEERGVFQYARMLDLLLLYAEELSKRESRPPCKYRFSAEETQRIIEAGNLKLESLDERLVLKELGKKVNMHPKKLEAGFRQVYGQTTAELERNTRLEKAKQLLLETDKSVTDIAMEVGYTRSALARAFKKKYGISPGDYRK